MAAIARARAAVSSGLLVPTLRPLVARPLICRSSVQLPQSSPVPVDFRAPKSDSTASRRPSAIAQRLPDPEAIYPKQRFREFQLDDRVFVVTGGAGGLGLVLAEALVEAGGHATQVHCLDRAEQPPQHFWQTKEKLAHQYDGSLHYERVDVTDAHNLDEVIGRIADRYNRLDGLVAAAAIQNVKPALDWTPQEVSRMMLVNVNGVFYSACSCARQMIKHDTPGSMVLVGSMSGVIANRDFHSSIYNAGKAAVIQMTRNLAMEWAGVCSRPIRVNSLNPGNIRTPMVEKNIEDEPRLQKLWEAGNMFGRLSTPDEYRGAVLYMLSDASSFMTGSKMVIDGGYTAW